MNMPAEHRKIGKKMNNTNINDDNENENDRQHIENFISKVSLIPGGESLPANLCKDITISRTSDLAELSRNQILRNQVKLDLHLFVAISLFSGLLPVAELSAFEGNLSDLHSKVKLRFTDEYIMRNHPLLWHWISENQYYQNENNKYEHHGMRLALYVAQKLGVNVITFDRVAYSIGSGKLILDGPRLGPKARIGIYKEFFGTLKQKTINHISPKLWLSWLDFIISSSKQYCKNTNIENVDMSEESLMNLVNFSKDPYLTGKFNPEDKVSFAGFWLSNRLNSGAPMAGDINDEESRGYLGTIMALELSTEDSLKALIKIIELEEEENSKRLNRIKYALYLEQYYKNGKVWPAEFAAFRAYLTALNIHTDIFGQKLTRRPTHHNLFIEWNKFNNFVESLGGIYGFWDFVNAGPQKELQ